MMMKMMVVNGTCVLGWKSDQVGSTAAWYWVYRAGSGCRKSAAESNCWNCKTRPGRSCQKSSGECTKYILYSPDN